ncbi:MAG: NUDIX domain-containing protein [Candidatus Cryptobacteroides sp.]
MDIDCEKPRPFALNHISVDCVVLGFDGERLNVLLLKREDMGLHDMKLPGSLIYADETPDDAASRVISELTGLTGLELEQFRTKTDPGNFYKKVALMPYVVPLESKQTGGRHRAARYYKYDKKAYKKGKF